MEEKMVNWSITYILSQIFTIIMYILLGLTYYSKERKKVLILNFLALIANGIAYIFLGAWTGLAMCAVALARNIIFLLDENKNGKREKINKSDIIILIILYVISIISAIYTYDGFLSLFSVFATMLYTFSVWQKKTSIYKILGIPIGILWILYNTYIMSIFGIILESVLFICSITGYILEKRNKC
jgi:hypothetical protein